MNIKFIPNCDKKGCDNPSTFVRYRMGAKGFIKSMYYCDEHKRDGDVNIIADLEQRRLDNRRKTSERPDLSIVGSKLSIPQRREP